MASHAVKSSQMAPTLSLVTLCAVSFASGYLLREYLKDNRPVEDESEYETEEESEEEVDIDLTALNEIPGEVRMTLVVRQDLKMGKGKAAAQCSHATLALYKKILNPNSPAYNPEMLERWEYGNGQAKITLQVPNQEDMDTLYAQAISMGVNATVVHDAGRTQIAAGSATVLGLGPAPKLAMDRITSELKLY